MNMLPKVLIFSCYRADNLEYVNCCNYIELCIRLNKDKIPYKQVDGCYKGLTEKSVVVPAVYESEVRALCKEYGQESYLSIDHERHAVLEYLDGSSESLGYFQPIPAEKLQTYDSWTYDRKTDTYYIVR